MAALPKPTLDTFQTCSRYSVRHGRPLLAEDGVSGASNKAQVDVESLGVSQLGERFVDHQERSHIPTFNYILASSSAIGDSSRRGLTTLIVFPENCETFSHGDNVLCWNGFAMCVFCAAADFRVFAINYAVDSFGRAPCNVLQALLGHINIVMATVG